MEFEKRISAEQELEELKGRRKERLAKRSKERRQRQKRRRTDLAQEVKDKDEIILEKDTLIRQLYALIDEKNAEIERLQSNAKPQPTQQTQQPIFYPAVPPPPPQTITNQPGTVFIMYPTLQNCQFGNHALTH